MTPIAPRLDGPGWLLLLALALMWSVSFIFIKVAVGEIPVLTLVLIRVGIAALALHAVILASGRRYPRNPAVLARFLLIGLVNNVLPFALIVYATLHIGAGAASILNAMAPIFTLLIAHFATRDEKITRGKLAGIGLGVAGVVAMVGPQALAGLSGELMAAAAMLAATFFYGLAALIGRSFRGIDPTVSAACQLTASTLIVAPAALLLAPPLASLPSLTAISAALALALVSTALAYVVFFQLLARAGATNTILVTLLIPLGGVLLSWLLLDEAFSAGEAAGMLLIGAGLVVIDGRALAWAASSAARPRPGSSP